MYTDRSLLKNNARFIMHTAKPSLYVAAIILIAVSFVLSYVSSSVMGVNIAPDDLTKYMRYYASGNYEAALSLLNSMRPPASAYLMRMVIQILLYILGAGFIIFIFNTIRNTPAVYGNLLDGFGIALKLIGLFLLQMLIIFLWSLLLFFPGLIAAYGYRMARYLLIDDPSKGVVQVLRESRQMMRGHKWECFVLDLSFLGWRLLCMIPYIGNFVSIYVTPYIETTFVLYYLALTGRPVIVSAAPGAV